ncbi:DUF3713 domain-containing protein [[Mycoplasma] testudinis]|uniref:DUF3713 domain-containing protein n=1 Tax=[Mycoplasma] testudinis TaxID=33924 RepID=UPI0004871587|nr:DUF3713 domain-containing protein [[Mycoplasma] testudinis]
MKPIKTMKKTKKLKVWTSLFAVSTVGGIAAFAAACSGPSASTLQSLFNNTSSDQFATSQNGSLSAVLSNGLKQSAGLSALLKDRLGHVLTAWYQDNANGAVRGVYNNFLDQINTQWDSQLKDYQNRFGNDYQVHLQTEVLDPVGGTEASWRANQLNQKILADFVSRIFQTNNLRLTTDTNSDTIVPSPSIDLFNPDNAASQSNWARIKYTAGGFNTGDRLTAAQSVQNNNQTFAQFQNAIFDYWVRQENPNLLSQTIFNNDTPTVGGLASLFNQNVIGSDSLTASYAFQAFKDNTNDPLDAKGNNAYRVMVNGSGGLSKYVHADGTIDIPNALSSGSGGKLLMTASDMFNSNDVSIAAAFVRQYLELSGINSANSANYDNIGSQFLLSTDNIMDNFLRANSTSDPASAWYAPNASYNNIVSNAPTTGFYGAYGKLADGTSNYKIYNVVKPTNGITGGTNANQFIMFRSTDGVHIIAIDGGSFYLGNGTRDIAKQEQFLKYRAFLASLPNGVNANVKYTFDLQTQLSNYFNANQDIFLFKILQDALNKTGSFTGDPTTFLDLPSNAKLKEAIQIMVDDLGTYVNAWDAYNRAQAMQSTVATERSKLDAWGKTYIDLLKANTPAKIGIAAPLPYVRQADGDYFGISEFYLQLIGNTTATQGNSRAIFENNVVSTRKAMEAAADALVASLQISLLSPIQYSQDVLLKAAKGAGEYDLAINLVIQGTIGSAETINSIKNDYFFGNANFNAIYGTNSTGVDEIKPFGGIDQQTLQNIIRTYYQQSVFNGFNNKAIYGQYTSASQLDNNITTAWNAKQIGLQPNSADAMSYFTFLYTMTYLLRDNLANFKAILSTQILPGTQAAVTWTVPANPNTLGTGTNNSGAVDPISTFTPNNNYELGASSTTTPTAINNNWNNDTVAPASNNIFNNSTNYFNYTSPTAGTNLYGFNGLSLSTSTGSLDSNVSTAIYSNYATRGSQGSLYEYGSLQDLENLINGISNQAELSPIVTNLSNRANLDVSQYFQKDSNGNDVLNFDEKKSYVLQQIKSLNNDVFNNFNGYIGSRKQPVAISASTTDRAAAYAKSDPLNQTDKVTRIAAYMHQVNFKDVQNLGTGSWTVTGDANNPGRLGLDLSSFLAIVAEQAMDPGTQNFAIRDLISTSTFRTAPASTPSKTGDFILVSDKRLYDALGNTWATQGPSNH